LDEIFEKGIINRDDVDQQVIDDIGMLKPEESMHVVQRLEVINIQNVKNMNGFIGGIVRRVKEDGIEEATLSSLGPDIQQKIEDLIEQVGLCYCRVVLYLFFQSIIVFGMTEFYSKSKKRGEQKMPVL